MMTIKPACNPIVAAAFEEKAKRENPSLQSNLFGGEQPRKQASPNPQQQQKTQDRLFGQPVDELAPQNGQHRRWEKSDPFGGDEYRPQKKFGEKAKERSDPFRSGVHEGAQKRGSVPGYKEYVQAEQLRAEQLPKTREGQRESLKEEEDIHGRRHFYEMVKQQQQAAVEEAPRGRKAVPQKKNDLFGAAEPVRAQRPYEKTDLFRAEALPVSKAQEQRVPRNAVDFGDEQVRTFGTSRSGKFNASSKADILGEQQFPLHPMTGIVAVDLRRAQFDQAQAKEALVDARTQAEVNKARCNVMHE